MPAGEEESPEPPPPGLGGISEEQHRVLAYASAVGREVDFALLVAAMGADDERLSEELERLVERGILRERPGGERFVFVDDGTRARVYQSLTASRLRVLHRKIAEAMERAYPDPPPELLGELGRHFFLGKVPERSLEYNRRAADLARSRGSPEEAAHFLERARVDLKSVPGDHATDEAALACELADLYYSVGDIRSADRLYSEALERAGPVPRLRARILLGRAEVARERLDPDAAAKTAREARELFARSGDVTGLASVHRILGRIAFQRGAYREAMDEGIRALDLLQPTGDARILGRLSIDIGDAFGMLGPELGDEALAWYDRAVQRLTGVEDWVEVARAHVARAAVFGPGRATEALDALALARSFADRAHEPRWTGLALAHGVEHRLALGRVDEAMQDNEQARRILERTDDPAGVELVAINDGLIQERRGAWDAAEAAYRGAIERGQAGGLRAETARAHFYLARLYFKIRDPDRAREAFRAATALDLPKLDPKLAPPFAELARALSHPADAPATEGDAP